MNKYMQVKSNDKTTKPLPNPENTKISFLKIWTLKPFFVTEIKSFLQPLLLCKRLLEEHKCKSFSVCHFFVTEKFNSPLRIEKYNSNIQEVYDLPPFKAPEHSQVSLVEA